VAREGFGAEGEEPPFSQGALFDFRQRLIEHGLDQRLLERTVEFARETGVFDWKKVPKKLRVAVDSSPLRGAGRVEEPINLLAHAARKLVAHVADLHGLPNEFVVDEMGIPFPARSGRERPESATQADRFDGTMGSKNLLR